MFTDESGRLQPIWSFFLSVVFSIAAFPVCGYIAYAIAGSHTLRFELVFRSLLALLLLFLYVWLLTVADHVETGQINALGLPRHRATARQCVFGVLIGVLLAAMTIVPILIWANVSLTIRLSFHRLPQVFAVVLTLLLGALAEELMFRGYPFQRLVEAVGPVMAIVVFSLLFGAVHWMNPGATVWGLINTVAIGVVLALAYLRTSALWLPWGIHFGWNFALGFLFGLPVSGLRLFNVVIRTTANGPRWLTGGSYGAEATASATVAVCLGLLIVCKLPLPQASAPTPPEPAPEFHEPEHPGSLPGIQP